MEDHASLFTRIQSQLVTKSRRIECQGPVRPKPTEVFERLVSGSIVLQKQISRSQLRWSTGTANTPAEVEKASKRFWGLVLVQIIFEAQLPICQLPVESEEQRSAYALRAFGVRRSKTLRNRARCWKKARQWFLLVRGIVFPKAAVDILDYLTFLEQEVGTKTCVDEFMSSLSVLEDAGQVATSKQLCKDRLVVAASKSVSASLKEGRTASKQAPTLSVAMLIALEIFICSADNPKYGRCIAWACLVCVWACMRISDLQGIDVSRLLLFAGGLKGVLTQTKTTGHDKKVAEVPFFICREANLSGHDWMQTGYLLWREFGHLDRSYLVWMSSHDLEEPIFKYARPEAISGFMRMVWSQLKIPRRQRVTDQIWHPSDEMLVANPCFLFWGGHSMRHVLPTLAAVFGEPKERRDYLGRWHVGLHQSADYVHTCKQIVHDVQRLTCDKLSGGRPGYDESELFTELFQWLQGRGVDAPEPLIKPHRILRKVQGCFVLNQRWPLLKDAGVGLLPAPPDVITADPTPQGGESPFWISVSRHSGHRRLHIRDRCWVSPSSCFQVVDAWEVTPTVADSFCKLCYRDSNTEDSSSSGESSSTDLGADQEDES